MYRRNINCQAAAIELAAAHLETGIEAFASHDCGINGGEKRPHRVILGHEEEVDGAVGACDVTVEADAQAENDFAHDAHCKR